MLPRLPGGRESASKVAGQLHVGEGEMKWCQMHYAVGGVGGTGERQRLIFSGYQGDTPTRSAQKHRAPTGLCTNKEIGRGWASTGARTQWDVHIVRTQQQQQHAPSKNQRHRILAPPAAKQVHGAMGFTAIQYSSYY